MAYRYCHFCGDPIENPPTIQEDLRDGQYAECCGTKQPQDRSNTEWLIALWERIDNLVLTNSLRVEGINVMHGDAHGTTGAAATGEEV